MKKFLIFALCALLLSGTAMAAIGANKLSKPQTIVGIVKSINMNEQSFAIEKAGLMRYLYIFFGFLKAQRNLEITIVATSDTEFKRKTDEGVTEGSFTDLAVNQRVQIKGSYITEQTPATAGSTKPQPKINATGVFILTPIQATPKKCQTDADCAWCGTNCLRKDVNRMCIQISPPEGFNCQCVNNVCKKMPVSPTTTAPTAAVELMATTCQQVCANDDLAGICREWPVTAKAKFGCNKNEIEIGQTKDCTTIVDGQPMLGIGKTCCCK